MNHAYPRFGPIKLFLPRRLLNINTERPCVCICPSYTRTFHLRSVKAKGFNVSPQSIILAEGTWSEFREFFIATACVVGGGIEIKFFGNRRAELDPRASVEF